MATSSAAVSVAASNRPTDGTRRRSGRTIQSVSAIENWASGLRAGMPR